MGRTEFLTWKTITSGPGWQGILQRERNGALFGVHGLSTLKKRLTAPTLLERRCYTNNNSANRIGGCINPL
jgi:hypothetical protein